MGREGVAPQVSLRRYSANQKPSNVYLITR